MRAGAEIVLQRGRMGENRIRPEFTYSRSVLFLGDLVFRVLEYFG